MQITTKTLLLFLIAILTINQNGFSQQFLEWSKNYGGSLADSPRDIINTADGGIIVTGFSESSDGDVSENYGIVDVWVVKMDIDGNIEWEKNYGGSSLEISLAIKQTTDDGFIVVGWSSSTDGDVMGNNGDRDAWVIKLDNGGNIEWSNNYGGSEQDLGVDIVESSDGGYVLLSNSRSNDGDVGGNNGLRDYWVVKLDSQGNIEWEKNYGGSAFDTASSIKLVSSGGYIISGFSGMADGDVTGNYGSNDSWLVKIDNDGNIEWQKNYGGTENDVSYAMNQTMDGGYVLVGRSASMDIDLEINNGEHDSWIMKLDAGGNLEWSKNYGGTLDEEALSVIQTTDGKYIIVGGSESNDGDVAGNNGIQDCWILKLDSEGELEWKSTYGGTNDDLARDVVQVSDHEFIVANWSESSDGDYVNNNGDRDMWLMKLNLISTSIQNPNFDSKVTISPNPTNGHCIINMDEINSPVKVDVFDTMGRIFFSKSGVQGSLSIDDLPKGNYYVQIVSADFSVSRKLVVL